jgi:hypothetical protein
MTDMRLRLFLWWVRLTSWLYPCPLCGRYLGRPHPICVLRVEDAMHRAGIL